MLVVIGLLFVAALAGYLGGARDRRDDDSPAVAQTTTAESEPGTTEAATTEATETAGEEADGAAVFAEAAAAAATRSGLRTPAGPSVRHSTAST